MTGSFGPPWLCVSMGLADASESTRVPGVSPNGFMVPEEIKGISLRVEALVLYRYDVGY